MKKEYLTEIHHPRGAFAGVEYYADTPNKKYRLYYCGTDTGERFEYLGNAARALSKLADAWKENGAPFVLYIYSPPDDIPRRGSNA